MNIYKANMGTIEGRAFMAQIYFNRQIRAVVPSAKGKVVCQLH